MRVRRGSTLTEALEDLNYAERTAFNKVIVAAEQVDEAARAEEKAQRKLHRTIREALFTGVPAVLLAHKLNLTVGRIYQIKMDYQPNRERVAS